MDKTSEAILALQPVTLKEHWKVEEEAATIARMKKQIESLTTGLQKVTAEIESSKPVPHIAINN